MAGRERRVVWRVGDNLPGEVDGAGNQGDQRDERRQANEERVR